MNEAIPGYVLDALEDVRDSGLTNMWYSNTVIDLMVSDGCDHPLAQAWLEKYPKRYAEALLAMGERRVQQGKARRD
jgi:hypothetical protein